MNASYSNYLLVFENTANDIGNMILDLTRSGLTFFISGDSDGDVEISISGDREYLEEIVEEYFGEEHLDQIED